MLNMFAEGDEYTKTGVAANAERLNFRFQAMFQPIAHLLENKTILEVGSHNGRWSWVCLHLGAKKVIGIEKDPAYVSLAVRMLQKRGFRKDQFKFHRADCLQFKKFIKNEKIDIILCMGLLYYLNDPLDFVVQLADLGADLCIIDTFHNTAGIPNYGAFTDFLGQHFGRVNQVALYDGGNRSAYHCWLRPMTSL